MRNSGNQMCFKLFLQDNLRLGVFLRNQQRLICRRSRRCVLQSHRKRNACLNMCALPCLSDLLSELAWCLFFTAGTRRITLILGSMSSMMNNLRWAFTVVLQFPISTKCFSILRKCPKWGITKIYRTISSIKIFFQFCSWNKHFNFSNSFTVIQITQSFKKPDQMRKCNEPWSVWKRLPGSQNKAHWVCIW